MDLINERDRQNEVGRNGVGRNEVGRNETENVGKNGVTTNNLQQITLFISPSMVRIQEKDFSLEDNRIPIGLKDMDCTIILFYINNKESVNLGLIFAEVAETAAGIKFGAVNMRMENKIAEAFVRVKSNPSSVIHWAGLKQYPFILVYRGGLPVASYNGERSAAAITNWALTLACVSGYTELAQEFGGVQVDNDIEMSGVKTYSEVFKQGSMKTDSTQFKATEDIRGYDPSKGIKMVSRSEMREVGDSDQENEQESDQENSEGNDYESDIVSEDTQDNYLPNGRLVVPSSENLSTFA